MYAIIETGSKQYRVQPGDIIDIERLKDTPKGTIEFNRVLAVADDDDITFGNPHVEGATVSGKVVEDFRGKKLVVFKMKRRKGYRKKAGHRQNLSRVEILDIKN